MDPMIGKTIDNYRILEIIGRGGMGIVFKAMDESLEKIVALKMIDPVLAHDENFLRRFRREARALARLENPNIVTVYALRETDQGLFMVMEYVEAKTVSQWISENGPFHWREAVQLGKQLVDALNHAHKVGVIHRDIKPSNILVTSDGRVKVTDFGLAKVIRQHGRDSTVTQATAGTLYYMSPEQVKGLRNVDHRSDIYSAGMTIYEMLIGSTPFEDADSDFSIQKKIVEGKIPSPNKLNSDLPKQLVKIIQTAIATSPDKRFQSADEMLEAINEFEASRVWEQPEDKEGKSVNFKPVLLTVSALILIGFVFTFFHIPAKIGAIFQGGSAAGMTSLSINTVPAGALIAVNGDSVGESPINRYAVKAGAIQLAVRKKGYQPFDTTFTLAAKVTPMLEVTLEQLESTIPEQTVIPGATANVSFSSTPPDAAVRVNGSGIGQTPITHEFAAGRYQVRITKKGYAIYQRTVNLSAGEVLNMNADLKPVGGLALETEPAGAQIYLNGNRTREVTPHTYTDLIAGRQRVSLRLNGYQSYDTTVAVQQNNIVTLHRRLIQSIGELEILIRPFGSIYIDGKLVAQNTSATITKSLAAGRHSIRAVHETLGKWDKEVDVTANTQKEVLFNFNQTFALTVTSEPNYGEIYIDGKPTGEYTPKQLNLRPGIHIIGVHRDGFVMPEGPREITLESNQTANPMHFILKKADNS